MSKPMKGGSGVYNFMLIDPACNETQDDAMSARITFQQAKLAFDDCRYADARRLASQAETQVHKELKIEYFGTQPASPQVSVVIVIYRFTEDVKAALLEQSNSFDQYEVIIVDNGAGIDKKSIIDCRLNSFVLIDVGFNYGCCGGRNIGASVATSDLVAFIDDDGTLLDGSIAALVQTIEAYDAVAVRGRVVPKTENGATGSHYDLGDDVVFSPPTTEGISIWRRDQYLSAGGFDTLLSGHEGILLYTKLFRLFGPEAFLYAPEAVLRHDFAPNEDGYSKKIAHHVKMNEYITNVFPDVSDVKSTIINKRGDKEHAFLRAQICRKRLSSISPDVIPTEPISIITTSKNAAAHIHEYYQSLIHQTYRNFEIVFVDDGSSDGSGPIIQELFKGDQRLKYIGTTSIGRSAALNLALRNASNELCAIADVDDISMPHRLELTARYFNDNPTYSCVSFLKFNEHEVFGGASWNTSPLIGIRGRSITGMPVVFPAFAFRKSKFTQQFDEGLSAGVDCDWIHRNLRENRTIDGKVIPINMVYYRVHEDQITAKSPSLQNEVAIRCCQRLLADIVGQEEGDLERMAGLLTGRTTPHIEDVAHAKQFTKRLLQRNVEEMRVCQYELEILLNDFHRKIDISRRTGKRPNSQTAKLGGRNAKVKLILHALQHRIEFIKRDPMGYMLQKAKRSIRGLFP